MINIYAFHIGPQKAATTWTYHCLNEHPEVGCSLKDSTHYYDMLFYKGEKWYSSNFDNPKRDLKFIDPTPSYFRSRLAPGRIASDFPNAKIIFCLRNPIERAFSHYWHEKKKDRFNYRFEEVLDNYDLFCNWIEPGFYSKHIRNYLQYFPRQNVLCQLFDDLIRNPKQFIYELFKFLQIDSTFLPTVLESRINVARPKESTKVAYIKSFARSNLKKLGFLEFTYRLTNRLRALHLIRNPNRNMEQISDCSDAFLGELKKIYLHDICDLENMLSINLNHWK